VAIPVLTLPVRPARSMATLIEVAALDWRSRRRGVNTVRCLDERFKQRTARIARVGEGGDP
jgi:serine kinase of HPr protein (carbohydrate metabolism regulator)